MPTNTSLSIQSVQMSVLFISPPPPPHITILNINSTQSGSCSAVLLTQHMLLLVADQCFVTAYHSLEDGTNRLSCDVSKQLPIYITLHNNPQEQGTHLQQSKTLNLTQNSASSYFWPNYLACQIYLCHKWPDVNIQYVHLQVKCLLFLSHSNQTRIWSTILVKSLQHKIHENPPRGSRLVDRQTDITNPTAASHHGFANMSQHSSSLSNAVTHQKGILVNTTCL